MKPFDPQKAKDGHPLVTRDGRPAKFIAHVLEARPYPRIVALLGSESIATYTEQGAYYTGGVESEEDLFMAPHKVKHSALLKLYSDGTASMILTKMNNSEHPCCVGERVIEWEVEE